MHQDEEHRFDISFEFEFGLHEMCEFVQKRLSSVFNHSIRRAACACISVEIAAIGSDEH